MRRAFIIFILMLMPLQATWAVAATYCTHAEKGVAAQHFGHHAEEHAAGKNDAVTDNGTPSESGNAPDLSHGKHCHHFSMTGLLNDAPPVFHHLPNDAPRWTVVGDTSNVLGPRIERPNWIRLA